MHKIFIQNVENGKEKSWYITNEQEAIISDQLTRALGDPGFSLLRKSTTIFENGDEITIYHDEE